MHEPPVITPPVNPPPAAAPRRGAWMAFLGLMTAYILAITFLGHSRNDAEAALSSSTRDLFIETLISLGIFAVPFAIGLFLTRPSRADLFSERPISWLLTPVLGAVWSIVLRVAIMIPAVLAVMIFMAADPKNGIQNFAANRPKVESLLDPKALANPVYALVCMTWVSFVLAGLREELWRAVMIRGICHLGPASANARRMEWFAVIASSLFFGLAHIPQGWIGVAFTGILGLGLGLIQILRRSLPEAVLAHGFFDATTFFALFILQQREWLKRLGIPDNLLDQMLKSGAPQP